MMHAQGLGEKAMSRAGQVRNGGKAGFPPAAAPPKHIRTHDQIPLLLVVAPRVRADAKMREAQHCVDPGTRDVLIVVERVRGVRLAAWTRTSVWMCDAPASGK